MAPTLGCSGRLRGLLRGAGESFLTPIRLFVWLRAPQLRLRHLAAAAHQVASLPGGPALGALCSQALHGDPAVHTVRSRLQLALWGGRPGRGYVQAGEGGRG